MMNVADKCRAEGWTAGTRLQAMTGNIVEVTAVGEVVILVKGIVPCSGEKPWAWLDAWRRVDTCYRCDAVVVPGHTAHEAGIANGGAERFTCGDCCDDCREVT